MVIRFGEHLLIKRYSLLNLEIDYNQMDKKMKTMILDDTRIIDMTAGQLSTYIGAVVRKQMEEYNNDDDYCATTKEVLEATGVKSIHTLKKRICENPALAAVIYRNGCQYCGSK